MTIIVIFISFITGIASILSPCILPVLPILFGFLLKNRKNIEILGFVLGLFSIFTLVILLTAIFTIAINAYIYYFRIVAIFILITLGSLLLINKDIFKLNFKKTNSKIYEKGFIPSFTLGILTSLAWAPCYGTYLISLITFLASSGNVLYGILNIISYTLGFAFVLLILSLIISKINLDRIINSTYLVKKIFGVLIIIAGLYMLILLF